MEISLAKLLEYGLGGLLFVLALSAFLGLNQGQLALMNQVQEPYQWGQVASEGKRSEETLYSKEDLFYLLTRSYLVYQEPAIDLIIDHRTYGYVTSPLDYGVLQSAIKDLEANQFSIKRRVNEEGQVIALIFESQ